MQHPAAEDLQAQDSLFSGMRQIVINTSNGVSKTILAGMGISSFANIIPRNKGKCRSLGVFIITPPPQCHDAYNHVLGVGRKPLFGMDNPKRYIIGQSHDSRGNLANYHVVALWPCIVSGCSRNRLTRILWIEKIQSNSN